MPRKDTNAAAKPAATRKQAATAKSAAPRATRTRRKPTAIAHDQIANRAYLISLSPERGSDFENWIWAERELLPT